MSFYDINDIKPGMLVRLKTKKELLQEFGWIDEGIYLYSEEIEDAIVPDMMPFLGETVAIKKVDEATFTIVECGRYNWYPCMVSHICLVESVEEEECETYRDEDGNPFNPYNDYSFDFDFVKQVFEQEQKQEEEDGTTVVSAEQILRDFELYNKGYNEGFSRAVELFKEKFNLD